MFSIDAMRLRALGALVFCFVSAEGVFAQSVQAPASISKFNYQVGREGQAEFPNEIRFADGSRVALKVPAENDSADVCGQERLEITQPGGKPAIERLCEDRIQIRAVFPDAKNAKAAIVSTNCLGTICSTFDDFYVLYLDPRGISVAELGSLFGSPANKPQTSFSLEFTGNLLTKGRVSNIYSGEENDLGDRVPSARVFNPKGLFLDERFRQTFLKFLLAHPEEFMADEVARAPLVKAVGAAKFRSVRAAVNGPGSGAVVGGRLLILKACERHSCDTSMGAVVIDAVSGDVHILRVNLTSKELEWGSTKSELDDGDYEWLIHAFDSSQARVAIREGKLVLVTR